MKETMRALNDAVRAGKTMYVGISDAPTWVVSRSMTLAEWRGWTPFACLGDDGRHLGQLAHGVLSGEFTRPEGSDADTRIAAEPLGAISSTFISSAIL